MNTVIKILDTHLNQLTDKIKKEGQKENNIDTIADINEIKFVKSILEQLNHSSLSKKIKVHKLPPQKTRTPSSNYRIVEDNETDDIKHWIECDLNLMLNEGDVIIENLW